MRHLFDKHIPVVNTLDTYFVVLWENIEGYTIFR